MFQKISKADETSQTSQVSICCGYILYFRQSSQWIPGEESPLLDGLVIRVCQDADSTPKFYLTGEMKMYEDCRINSPEDIILIKTWHNPKKLCTYFVDVVNMTIFERDDRAASAIVDMGDGNQMNALLGLRPVYKITKI